jgi:hypothetical protein
MTKNQKGFSPVEIVVVIFVVVLVAVTSWLVWHKVHQKSVTANNHPTQNADSLTITEWHAKIPLTSDTKDAYYTYKSSDGTVTIDTHKVDTLLEGVKGCRAGLAPPTLERLKPGDRYIESATIFNPASDTSSLVKVGDYYVREVHYAISLCAVEPTQTTQQVSAILSSLSRQIPKMESTN